MTNSSIKAVVFDLGGVLVDWDPRHVYRELIATDREREWFLANVCTVEWHRHHDRGLPFSDGIRRKIAEFPEHADLIRAWDSRWADFYGGHDQGVVAVLQDLRVAGVPLFACTNWPGEKFPLARKMFPFLNWFGDIIVSGDEGVSKPDAKIFRILIDRCVLDPHHTLFIDDSAANVSAAQSHGFITHHFKDSEGLQVAINDLGL